MNVENEEKRAGPAAVILRQRETWEGFRAEVQAALDADDLERLKCLKAASEILRIAQECERRVWGVADGMPEAEPGRQDQAVAVNIDFSTMTPERINEIGAALACAAGAAGQA